MDVIEKKMSDQEIKDRVRTFKIMEQLCRRYASKYADTDHEKIVSIFDLSVSFLGNMILRYAGPDATKQDFLKIVEDISEMQHRWLTDVLNDLDYRKTLQ